MKPVTGSKLSTSSSGIQVSVFFSMQRQSEDVSSCDSGFFCLFFLKKIHLYQSAILRSALDIH